jgi:hypothetical protein
VPRITKRRPFLNPPEVRPGNWQGEIIAGGTINFGQAVQHGRRSVEISYLIIPAIFTPQEARFTWPGVIMIFAPTPMKAMPLHAGHLLSAKCLLSLSLSLEVTRDQFSDMLRMFEANKRKDVHFTVEDQVDGSWPVHSWGIQVAR